MAKERIWCPDCDGDGEIEDYRLVEAGIFKTKKVKYKRECTTCGGKGWLEGNKVVRD